MVVLLRMKIGTFLPRAGSAWVRFLYMMNPSWSLSVSRAGTIILSLIVSLTLLPSRLVRSCTLTMLRSTTWCVMYSV
uniref:Putative secreted peptide n=1 Tax=Anopheles braziliensis TaxID=58242 RepID=A0A2M3ZXG7_9DIPT